MRVLGSRWRIRNIEWFLVLVRMVYEFKLSFHITFSIMKYKYRFFSICGIDSWLAFDWNFSHLKLSHRISFFEFGCIAYLDDIRYLQRNVIADQTFRFAWPKIRTTREYGFRLGGLRLRSNSWLTKWPYTFFEWYYLWLRIVSIVVCGPTQSRINIHNYRYIVSYNNLI